jgi:hypothetical protein
MGRNILADIANTMPHMVAGRMYVEDFEVLAALADGVLTIDFLAETANHDHGGALSLRGVADLTEWLTQKLATSRLARSDLTQAGLVVAINTGRVPVDRSRIIPFQFISSSTFSTSTRTCSSKPVSALKWYSRDGGITD